MVGVGWAGKRQIEAVRELDGDLEVVGLVDQDAAHLKRVATEFDIQRYSTELDDVLSDPAIDAVSVCTPHGCHYRQSLRAISAGKHVLVEKPMAVGVKEADTMIREANRAGVCLYVAESQVYSPMSEWLRNIYQSSQYTGEVVSASVVQGFRAEVFRYPGRREWLTRPEMGGTGTWMLHGIHLVAQLKHVFGQVRSIYLKEHHALDFATPEIEGTMTGVITMMSGLSVTIVLSCESRIKNGLGGVYL